LNKPRGLGRGLDILLPSSAAKSPSLPATPLPVSGPSAFLCALERIVPNRKQPRRHFDDQALEELAASIREHGVIEPLLVRRIGNEDRFELVAGERRWRAAQRAGLREVLVVVKTLDDKHAFEIALIENVQREDLNAIEFANALRVLVDEHGHTQETLATAVGKDRATISNALRLLKLPERVQEWVVNGSLSEGHGRALLGATDEKNILRLAALAIARKMSVRQLEAEVRSLKTAGPESSAGKKKSPSIRDLEQRLERSLSTRCELKDKEGRGAIVIRYANLDELDRLLERLL
jgi:ParB family transcriptional regulator, chromosome partitioning protein